MSDEGMSTTLAPGYRIRPGRPRQTKTSTRSAPGRRMAPANERTGSRTLPSSRSKRRAAGRKAFPARGWTVSSIPPPGRIRCSPSPLPSRRSPASIGGTGSAPQPSRKTTRPAAGRWIVPASRRSTKPAQGRRIAPATGSTKSRPRTGRRRRLPNPELSRRSPAVSVQPGGEVPDQLMGGG